MGRVIISSSLTSLLLLVHFSSLNCANVPVQESNSQAVDNLTIYEFSNHDSAKSNPGSGANHYQMEIKQLSSRVQDDRQEYSEVTTETVSRPSQGTTLDSSVQDGRQEYSEVTTETVSRPSQGTTLDSSVQDDRQEYSEVTTETVSRPSQGTTLDSSVQDGRQEYSEVTAETVSRPSQGTTLDSSVQDGRQEYSEVTAETVSRPSQGTTLDSSVQDGRQEYSEFTTAQPRRTLTNAGSVSSPSQRTTPIPEYIETTDQHQSVTENNLSETKTETDFSKYTKDPDDNMSSSKVSNEQVHKVISNQIASTQQPVITTLLEGGDDNTKVYPSSSRPRKSDQTVTNENINSSIDQNETQGNNASILGNTFTSDDGNSQIVDQKHHPANENSDSIGSPKHSVSFDETHTMSNVEVKAKIFENSDGNKNKTIFLEDIDDFLTKRNYYNTSSHFNGNTSESDNSNRQESIGISEPTGMIQDSSSSSTTEADGLFGTEVIMNSTKTTTSDNDSTTLSLQTSTTVAPTLKPLTNFTTTTLSATTTTTVSPESPSSSSSTEVSSSPPSTNDTSAPPSDSIDNSHSVHQFFMDLKAHTMMCLVSLLLLLLAGTIIFSFVLAFIFTIKYCVLGIVKLFESIKKCCQHRNKSSSNSGFHESGSLFPRCDVNVRPFDPSNQNDRDMMY